MNDPGHAQLSLGDLIAPLPVADFLGQFWQRRHYHAAGSAPLLERLRAILGSFDVGHLLGLSTMTTAFAYAGGRTDRREQVPVPQALDLYERDFTLYFTPTQSPSLRDLAATVARDTGISTLSTRCSVFASKTSGGLQTHFDNNENFTVQLTGTKVWTIWPNTVVERPIHAYRRGEPLIDADAGMYIDARARFADLGPGEEVVMSPGSILYHPRGSFHATRAASESVSLNVCIEPMTWYDLMFGSMAARLMSSPALRAIVPAVPTTHELGEVAHRIRGVVTAAQSALAELTPEDAAEACLAPPGLDADLLTVAARCKARISATSRLRRNSLAVIDVLRGRDGTVVHVSLLLGRMTRQVVLRAPAELGPACERVAGPEREWSPRKLAGGTLREEHLVEVARALAAVGAVRVVSGTR